MRGGNTIFPGRGISLSLAVFSLSLVVIIAAGCGGSGDSGAGGERMRGEDAGMSREEAQGLPGYVEETVHMCGRSVLGGWFEHWGWDYDIDRPVHLDGFQLVYHEMDSPPGIVDTALEVIRRVSGAGGKALFFKLCFADFEGGDEETARYNLRRNQEMISEVVDAAAEEGLKIIIGNALPLVRSCTDRWLVWNQREYNAFLEGLESEGVFVLDLYGTLAAPEGWLQPEYAAGPHDSHLNDSAYSALDQVLIDTLSRVKATH